MRIARPACIAALVLLTGAAEEPAMKALPTPEIIAGLLQIDVPNGWTRTAYANTGGVDFVVAFERGANRLLVRVFGAKRSSYRTPEDFLSGPAAGTLGRAAGRKGAAKIDGRTVALFERGFPLLARVPHGSTPAKPQMGTETFCVLPPSKDGRFIVLSYQRESPIPDLKGTGEKAWEVFLRGVRMLPLKKK